MNEIFYEKFKKLKVPNDGYSVMPAFNKMPTIRINDRLLHSCVDPIRQTEQQISKMEFEPLDTIIVYGFGLGYHLNELAMRVSSECWIIVIEPDPKLLKTALDNVDLTPFLSRRNSQIVLGDDFERFNTILRQNIEHIMVGVQVVELLPEIQAHSEYFKNAKNAVKSYITALAVIIRTSLGLSKKSSENEIYNIPEYVKSSGIIQFKDRFKGYPGLVVSAGPSLAKNKHLLPKLKGKCVIMAVSTAFKIIQDLVEPDFTVVLDYHEISSQHFDGLISGAPMICDAKASDKAIRAYKGPKLFTGGVLTDRILWDMNKGNFEMGATVAHTAASFLNYAGCEPLIFVGQDLSFSGGMVHAPGSGIFDRWHNEINRFNTFDTKETDYIIREGAKLKMTLDIFGNRIYTEENMITYRVDFEIFFKNWGKKVYNATEGGVNIGETENVTLQYIIDEVCTEDIPEELFKIDYNTENVIEKAIETMEKRIKEFKECEQDMLKMIELVKRFNNRIKNGKDGSAVLKQIHKHKSDMTKYEDLFTVLSTIGRSELRRSQNQYRTFMAKGLKGDELREAQGRRDRMYMEGLYYASRWLRERLSKCMDMLKKELTCSQITV